MDEELLSQFVAITSAAPDRASQYLRLTDNNLEQAIQLYFESDGVDMGASLPSQQPSASRGAGSSSANAINIDDDEADFDQAAQANRDEEMARRMQQEMYGGQGGSDEDEDAVRAPDARRMDTLVGGPSDWQDDDTAMNAAVFDQLNRRQRRAMGQRGRPGIFNQQPPSRSIWNQGVEDNEDASSHDLSRATGGASDVSSKSNMLARMFQPPFDLITSLRSIDGMRSEGKEEEKWIMVNVQDPNIFDCQVLNRDLWKHEEIRNTIKSNFIFKQYNKGDMEAQEYIRLYFPLFEADNEYPHISILDPRTGEQVKTWSGPPAPKAGEFLMQLHEFLDRYSLDEFSRNPVAKRKPEPKKQLNIDKMSEEEMLQMAMQESMGGAQGQAAASDPDDLTRSVELSKGKDKVAPEAEEETPNGETTLFASISSSNPHAEPEASDKSATRIQFRHSSGRIVRRFLVTDPVRRIFEWLRASPIEGKQGIPFELRYMGKDLIEHLDETIEEAGLKNGSVNVEFES